MMKTKVLICPYCGETQANAERCRGCGGLFEPLSRQATHNAMGPWFVRDPGKPFQPGCSYETLVKMIDRGQLGKYAIVRGPTTKQFWTVAKHVPGVAHLLGYCHNCDASVDAGDHGCHVCGVPFGAYLDRNYLGLPDTRPLPWEADMEGAAGGSNDAAGMGHPARGSGISGFASDDELLGTARMQPQTQHRTPDAEFGGDTSASSSVFEEHVSPVTTAMRRKLEGQHRTIRTLTIVLGAVIIISAIGMMSVSQRSANSVAPAPRSRSATAPAPDATSQTHRDSQLPVASDQVPAHRPESIPDSTPDEAAEEPADEQAAPVVDPTVAAYTRAQQLIESAGREDRPIEDRMADLERALDELKSAAATASDANRPADLDDTTAQVERELERLRLEKDFFGVDG